MSKTQKVVNAPSVIKTELFKILDFKNIQNTVFNVETVVTLAVFSRWVVI